MLTLRVVHAHEGDSLLLIHGAPGANQFLLVDGGPAKTFVPHLSKVLGAIQPNQLEAICLSHVDTDHTTGLQELLAELRDQTNDGEAPLVQVGDFWINEFGTTIDSDGRNRAVRLANVLAAVNPAGAMQFAGAAVQGIKHGHGLVVLAKQLGVPVNNVTGGKPWIAGQAQFALNDVLFTVVGPTVTNLAALRTAWDEWLGKQEGRIAAGKLGLAAMADKSIPNLSSIQLLVESAASGKRLLLTGDGRGDHLLDALEEADLLDNDGGIDVDVLKVPHHGSDRNVNLTFFERVRAKTYVVSANGKDDNPDKPTLEWMHKAAKKQGRTFELVLTNLPPDATEFVQQTPPGQVYQFRVRDPADDFIDVVIDP